MADSAFTKGKLLKSTDIIDIYELIYGLGSPDATPLEFAYTKNGKEIGDAKHTQKLINKYGITEFDNVDDTWDHCTIGYNPEENTWYGWTHRGIYGFNIGHKVKQGDVVADEGIPIGFEVKTKKDSKKLARKYSEALAQFQEYEDALRR